MIAALRPLLAILFAVLPLFSAQAAGAQERITNFVSDIAIDTNGTLTVREEISVQAENAAILHGIFRDFPTTYIDRTGNRVRVRFDVEEVLRDGRPEPYVVQRIDNGRRVRIGDADTLVLRGPHTYVIVYKTDRQIGFFSDFDELYWNVTGNGWDFAIDSAEAVVHLPQGARTIQYDWYTGRQGAQDKNARASTEGNTVRFVTTASLNPREGLTIAVGFTKGVISPPGGAELAANFFRDNAATGAALLGFVALGAFYYAAWSKFGRDPARGVIIPLFAPPKNFSPAAVRFVRRMGYDRKAFAAALIAMAVKGYLKITEEGGTYKLSRTGRSETEAMLATTEAAIARAIFSGTRDEIVLKNSNHRTVSRAIKALSDALRREDEGVYFVTNRKWFFAGLGILVASGAAAALLAEDPEPIVFMLVWVGGWTAGTAALGWRVLNAWSYVANGPGWAVVRLIGAVFQTLFAIPFIAVLIFGLYFLSLSVPWALVGAMLAQGLLATVFYRLLKAPTLAGGKIRDEIEGFRKFLVTTEKDRLEVLHPPDITPELFEKFLPYAIALDAENAWSRKFEAQAARAGETPPARTYSPSWYSGPGFRRLGTTGFASAIGASVAGATAAAATAPGRASGSGGGGSSGGGGGGGGGGGW